jgi:hypothetical protein
VRNEDESQKIAEIWTFSCVNGSCKKKLADKNSPRISFLSCVHQCSKSISIWPKVMSERFELGSNKFSQVNLKYKIITSFKPVEELLDKAVKIFMQDLNQLRNYAKGEDGSDGALVLEINVDGSDELTLTMDTDECYNLSISVGINSFVNLPNFFLF